MYRYKLMSQYQYRKIDVNNLIKFNFQYFPNNLSSLERSKI